MLRSAVKNVCVANNMTRGLSQRQYHMFSRRQHLPDVAFQAGQTPGAVPSAMGFIGLIKRNPKYCPSKLFTTAFIKKNLGVTPIIALMGFWAVGVTSFAVYAAMTRDVVYTRHGKSQDERIDLRNPKPQKLITINEKYVPNPQLQDLLDEIRKGEPLCICDDPAAPPDGGAAASAGDAPGAAAGGAPGATGAAGAAAAKKC